MDNFSNTIVVVFTLLDVWFLWQIAIQLKEISISSRFLDSLKVCVLIVFILCAGLLIVDLVNQRANSLLLVMTSLMLLVFFQRDGIGKRGFIAKGVFVAYADVKHMFIEREEKLVKVSFTYKETVRKDRKEGSSVLMFDEEKENEVRQLLEPKFTKKAVKSRRKKGE